MRQGGKLAGGGRPKQDGINLSDPIRSLGQTRDHAGKALGGSGTTSRGRRSSGRGPPKVAGERSWKTFHNLQRKMKVPGPATTPARPWAGVVRRAGEGAAAAGAAVRRSWPQEKTWWKICHQVIP